MQRVSERLTSPNAGLRCLQQGLWFVYPKKMCRHFWGTHGPTKWVQPSQGSWAPSTHQEQAFPTRMTNQPIEIQRHAFREKFPSTKVFKRKAAKVSLSLRRLENERFSKCNTPIAMRVLGGNIAMQGGFCHKCHHVSIECCFPGRGCLSKVLKD